MDIHTTGDEIRLPKWRRRWPALLAMRQFFRNCRGLAEERCFRGRSYRYKLRVQLLTFGTKVYLDASAFISFNGFRVRGLITNCYKLFRYKSALLRNPSIHELFQDAHHWRVEEQWPRDEAGLRLSNCPLFMLEIFPTTTADATIRRAQKSPSNPMLAFDYKPWVA